MNSCKFSVFFLLITTLLLSTSPTFAQNGVESPWGWVPFNELQFNVIFDEATFDGDPLEGGDWIGAFTPDGLCAGAFEVDPENEDIGVTAWGDNDPDDEVTDGFEFFEDVSFRIWIGARDGGLAAEITDIRRGEAIWFPNDLLICSINASPEDVPPEMELREIPLEFGEIWVGWPESHAIDIYNGGGQDLIISGAEVTEGSEYFSPVLDEDLVVGWRTVAQFFVTYDPAEAGEHSATITLTTNDGGEEDVEVEFEVSGSARVPDPPMIVLAANEYTYRETRLDRRRGWYQMITNDGEEPLVIDNVTFDPDNGIFTSNFANNIEILGGDSAGLLVTFSPADTIEYAATMTISSNDPDNDLVDVSLSGEGVLEGDPEILLMPPEHFFPNVVVERQGMWRMRVLNVGAGDLFIDRIESDDDVFTFDFPVDPVRLRPDDFYLVNVYFEADQAGFYDGSLTLFNDDPINGEYVVELGALAVEEDELHFRYYPTDTNHSILIESITLDDEQMDEGDEVGIFTQDGLCAGGGVVEADGQFGVRAYGDDPESEIVDGFVDDESFIFRVWDADADYEVGAVVEYVEGPEVFSVNAGTRVNLSAESVDEPNIELSDEVHYFGQADYDDAQVKEWMFQITNIGVGELTIDAIDSDLEEYTYVIEDEFPITLAQNEPLDVVVFFAPTAEQEYDGRLTIYSDDPMDDILYLDLHGIGVEEVIEPDFSVERYNHFFGVQHVLGEEDAPHSWVLTIDNIGGGDLVLNEFGYEGSDVFSTDIQAEQILVEADASVDITIFFHPLEEGEFTGTLTAVTDDPFEEDIAFDLWGFAAVSDDNFLHYETEPDLTHSIVVTDAFIYTLGGDETRLVPGDEIAVFTPLGLCAGHTYVTEEAVEEGAIGISAWSNDANSEFLDGFEGGDEIIFRFWDWTVGDELDMYGPEDEEEGVIWGEGPDLFEVEGVSDVVLRAPSIHDESQIVSTPPLFNLGPVKVETEATTVFVISNSGGVNLTITGVESDMEVFTHDFNNEEEIVLGEDESFDLTVTFTPARTIGYEGSLTIHSTDPDQPEFVINPVGMGTNQPGHYQWLRTGTNHTIAILELDIGGGPPAIGDEIATFTPGGYCAGSFVVEDPDGDVGFSAFGDENNTELLVEGFDFNDVMVLRYWDDSQGIEYSSDDDEYPVEIEIIQGRMTWFVNQTTLMTISVPAVGPDPVANIDTQEGAEISFDLTMSNQDEVDYVWEAANFELGDLDVLEDEELTFVENDDGGYTFTWPIGFDAVTHEGEERVRVFELDFDVTADDYEDGMTVIITVDDINRAPEVVAPLENDQATIQEDDPNADEDGWVAIMNLAEVFADADIFDVDRLLYYDSQDQQYESEFVEERVVQDEVDAIYSVRTQINWSGEVELAVIADDREADENRDGPVRQLRSTDRANETPLVRSMRRTAFSGNPGNLPHRDVTTLYVFTLIVTADNDAPVITEPSENDEFHPDPVDEGDLYSIDFAGGDVDNDGADLIWSVSDDGGLPGEFGVDWDFVDAGDGTANFTWDTDNNSWRGAGYEPVFRLTDPDDGFDEITLVINPNDINLLPYLDEDRPNNVAIDEDTERVDIIDLREVILDDDNEDDLLNFRVLRGSGFLGLLIDNGMLTAQPLAQFNTWGDDADAPINIEIEGEDRERETVVWEFTFTVNPVNDGPGPDNDWDGDPFELTAPADNEEVGYDPIPDTLAVLFDWTDADQNRYEIDEFHYMLYAFEADNNQDSIWVGPLAESELLVNIGEVVEELELPLDQNATIVWGVLAVDDGGLWAEATNYEYRVFVRVLSVFDNDLGIPDHFSLTPAFPNPFNAQTTIRFGLPQQTSVEISVWDMHGRKISVLTQGHHAAGYYNATWNAADISSGVYIIRMDTPEYRNMQKAILLR